MRRRGITKDVNLKRQLRQRTEDRKVLRFIEWSTQLAGVISCTLDGGECVVNL